MTTELLRLTAHFVGIPSVSKDEAIIASDVAGMLGHMPWLEVTRVGDNVVGKMPSTGKRRVMLAGHLDTVPPAPSLMPHVKGNTLYGVGAADMKGSLSVMLLLASVLRNVPYDFTYVFYAREEIARSESGLEELFELRPDLMEADVALIMEPTANLIEAGCQGSLRALVTASGVRAHTSRPFMGRNAIHRLAPLLGAIAVYEPREVTMLGCRFTEQLQTVGITGGTSPNVVPDAASLRLNFRFAPDRTSDDAVDFLHGFIGRHFDLGTGDAIEIEDLAPSAVPAMDDPLIAELANHIQRPAKAKVGWTDVATLAARGIPSVNFGPGDPLLAHHPEEHITASALDACFETLFSVLSGHPAPER